LDGGEVSLLGGREMALLNYRNPGDNMRLWRVYANSVLRYGTFKKIVNALRTEAAYRRRDVFVRSKPYILFVEPLYYCNLECPLCDRQVFPEARDGDAGKLSLETYDRVLDELGDYLFQCQIFGQGEPLMNWRLTRQIIERTHARRIFTEVSTNAKLLDEEVADDIVDCGLDYLVCAIDGVSQESYETYRVGGRLDDAMAGLRHVLAARARKKSSLMIEWQFLVHAGNEHELPTAYRMAAALGVPLRVAPLRGMEWDAALEERWLPESGPWTYRFDPARPLNDFPCYFLWRSLVLNSNSKVARCLIYQNATQYADLRHGSAIDAYNHPSVQQARRLFRREAPLGGEAPTPCRSCGQFARHHGDPVTDRNSEMRQALARTRAEALD
jgi:pyruvate-formate lyase-activating enzyme